MRVDRAATIASWLSTCQNIRVKGDPACELSNASRSGCVPGGTARWQNFTATRAAAGRAGQRTVCRVASEAPYSDEEPSAATISGAHIEMHAVNPSTSVDGDGKEQRVSAAIVPERHASGLILHRRRVRPSAPERSQMCRCNTRSGAVTKHIWAESDIPTTFPSAPVRASCAAQ